MKEQRPYYNIVTEGGEFCASSDSLEDARHYALVYGQDGPVNIYLVRTWLLDEFNAPIPTNHNH